MLWTAALPTFSLLPLAAQAVTAPAQHLERPLGRDFELADWAEVSGYFERLAEESPRVELRRLGETTEGRDLLLAVISSEENLARQEELRAHAQTLADPRRVAAAERERAVAEGRVILFITCAMHATETASPQMAMELAHRLATSDEEPWPSVRENVVVCLVPSLNPDGQDHVVSWYRETVGTPYEASGLLKLYQYYAGHDNNRDWFMLSQDETRLVTEQLYQVWFPQVYWDVHEQGSARERFFVPPFRDPLNPNLDPGIITSIDLLGTRALYDLTRAGLEGVSTGVSYDMWWNGGNRNVPVRHNIVGLLTEAASVRIGTPIFLPRSELSAPRGLGEYGPSNRFPAPWPGGWWRLRDIMDYELEFARSLVTSLARERELWLRGALEAAERAVARGADTAPRAWIVPSDTRDVGAARRLIDALMSAGIEVHQASEAFEAGGREWPAGSLLLRRDQPYGAHLQDLFEVQRYPDGEPPYDVAGWTLPLLLGVERAALVELPVVSLTLAATPDEALSAFRGDPRRAEAGEGALSARESDHWPLLLEALAAGRSYELVTSGERAGLLLAGEGRAERREEPLLLERLPRIGVYAPWSGVMNEGWLRYLLDSWSVPYVSVRNEALLAGRLEQLVDVLVLPSLSQNQLDRGRAEGSVPADYSGGLAPEGAVAIEEFVRGGGTLICLERSSEWAIELLRLPLVDVTRGPDAGSFSCPGSVLRTVPVADRFTAGLDGSLAVFFSGSRAWREMTEEERKEKDLPEPEDLTTLLRFAPTRVLLSGWIRGEETIAGRSAWLRAGYGEGAVHLFAFRPQYRGWSQAAFPLILRAALFETR